MKSQRISSKYFFLFIGMVFLFNACAGKTDYTMPSPPEKPQNTITINLPKDEVWKKIIPEIGKSFFVINNIDKDSGLVNISFSGNPEWYLDCGTVFTQVSNLAGERTYMFPGEKQQQCYEIMENGKLFQYNRTMDLEGRINLIVEESNPHKTIITINTKYIVRLKSYIADVGTRQASLYDNSITFNTGGCAQFPMMPTTCCSNGKLEKKLLDIIKSPFKEQ